MAVSPQSIIKLSQSILIFPSYCGSRIPETLLPWLCSDKSWWRYIVEILLRYTLCCDFWQVTLPQLLPGQNSVLCPGPGELPQEFCNPGFALFTGKFNICATCHWLKHYNTCSLNAISTHTCNSKPPSALNTCWFSTDFFFSTDRKKTTVKYFNFPYILTFMLFFRKVDEAWNNRRFLPFYWRNTYKCKQKWGINSKS